MILPKNGPIAGATSKRGKLEGWFTTREMSNTESEGHCLSAASFVAFKLCTCATKAAEFTHRLVP